MSKSFQTVSMIGLGYIGLPTAAVLSSRGVKVIGVDINQHAVDTINQGRIHIVEPDWRPWCMRWCAMEIACDQQTRSG